MAYYQNGNLPQSVKVMKHILKTAHVHDLNYHGDNSWHHKLINETLMKNMNTEELWDPEPVSREILKPTE